MDEGSEVAIPEDILLRFLGMSRESNLNEEALEVLIGIAKTGEGRSDLARKGAVPLILNAIPEIEQNLSLLSLSLKLLRNMCAGEIRNQDAFVENNGVDVILGAIRSRMVSPDVDIGVIRTALQVLANVSLAGDKHRLILWSRFFLEEFLLLARVQRCEILDPLCMIMYTCCDGNLLRDLDLDLSGQQALHALAELVRTASVVGFQEQWFGWLISKMCLDRPHLPALFAKLVDSSLPEDNGVVVERYDGFSSEQAYLISILSEILTKQIVEITVSSELALFIFQLFRRAQRVVDFSSTGRSSLPTGSHATDALGYTLLILRDICAQDSVEGFREGSGHAVQTLLSHGMLGLLLSILRELEPPAIIQKSVENTKDQESTSVDKLCPYRGFRRDIVAVIGNCAYGRKNAQDEVRHKNGLLLMLQQCVLDENNPFLREWGIWSMKNLLEGNAENESAVRDLEFQGSVTSPQIASLGLKVEVDPKSGRAKLINNP